jgi:hypothetical protein
VNGLNDYRELIPEFFYDGEFLSDPNEFDLGTVDGHSVNEVTLPAWAKSPMEFVYLHRKALESEIVSRRLNHWIDLIFGFQQRGEEAAAAFNVYRQEMYDDIWSKETDHSERRRREIETMIEQVGQVPPQLFFAPHVTREVPVQQSVLEQQVVVDLPCRQCLYGSFCEATSQLVVLDADACVIKCAVKLAPELEVQFERLMPAKKPPNDLGNFVRVSESQFAALCNQNSECVLIDFEKELEFRKMTNVRRKITGISSCDELIAISCSDARIHVCSSTQKQPELFSVPTYRTSVLCNCMSKRFGVVIGGTDDRHLIIASIHDGSTIRVVKLDSVPIKVVVTSNWGFILVHGCDYVDGWPQYTLSLFNINGLLVRTIPFQHTIDRWVTWTSPSGFDFMLLSTDRGKLYAFEVFFLDVGSPVYRCCAELIALDYAKASNMIVSVTSDGKVHMIPFITRTVEKYA